MKKSFSFLTAAAILLYAAVGHARICFLADTSCQEAGFAGSNECSSDPSSKKCPTKKKYSSYSDSCGVHYRDEGCLDGYCDINKLGILPEKYTFTSDKCDECFKGATCKLKNECDPNKHINSPENPFGDVCFAITSDCQIDKDTAFYSNCVCLSEYKIEESKCTEAGLTASDCCDDTTKGTLCKSCVCDSAKGWQSSGTCAYGVEDSVENPAGGTCYKCKTKPGCEAGETYVSTKNHSCSDANQTVKYRSSGDGWCASCVCKGRTSDFDAFWKQYYAEPSNATPANTCAMGQGKIEYNCAKLGYNMLAASGTKCKDGTEPYRCPFNHEEVYCASGLGLGLTITCPAGQKTYKECKDEGREPKSFPGQTFKDDDCVTCLGEVDPVDPSDSYDCVTMGEWMRKAATFTYYQNCATQGDYKNGVSEGHGFCHANTQTCKYELANGVINTGMTWADNCLSAILSINDKYDPDPSERVKNRCEGAVQAYQKAVDLHNAKCPNKVSMPGFKCSTCIIAGLESTCDDPSKDWVIPIDNMDYIR